MDKFEQFMNEHYEFKKQLRLRYENYDYERYKAINPELKEETYRNLWQNHALWKVVCGKPVVTHWGHVELKAVWWRDLPDNYARRFKHGFDGYNWETGD